MSRCVAACCGVLVVMALSLWATAPAGATWIVGPAEYTNIGDTYGENENCPCVQISDGGSGSSAWAKVLITALHCDDPEHEEHEGTALRAVTGSRSLSCDPEDEPGDGTIDAEGTRGFYRWNADPADASAGGVWEAELPDDITSEGTQCSHTTGQQLTFVLEAHWTATSHSLDLSDEQEALLLCLIECEVIGPEYPQPGTAGAFHNTTVTKFDVEVTKGD